MSKQTAAVSRGRTNGTNQGATRRAKPATRRRGTRATTEAGLAAAEATPRGAATLTDGLDPYDRERASSLADEGGIAGAAVEAQPPAPPSCSVAGRLWAGRLWVAASCGLAGLAALYLRRSK